MKKSLLFSNLAIALIVGSLIVSCNSPKPYVHENSSQNESNVPFDFSISFSNGNNSLNVNEIGYIYIDQDVNATVSKQRQYVFESSDPKIALAIDSEITGKKAGSVKITVTETNSNIKKELDLNVTDYPLANGNFDFSNKSSETKTAIIGALEKYGMDNHLTGLPLTDNSGYVKFSERVKLPVTEYIPNYGYGLLEAGEIIADVEEDENPAYKRYYREAITYDPRSINSRDSFEDIVTSLENYITSAYWEKRLNSQKDGYEWRSVLAKDTVTYNGQSMIFDRPIPIYNGQEVKPGTDMSQDKVYDTWRVYVKTGDDGLTYRYNGSTWSTDSSFDNRPVALKDYEFSYRLLFTHMRRKKDFNDKKYAIKGMDEYYRSLSSINGGLSYSDEDELNVWNSLKADGRLGIQTGTDPVNGNYIQLTLLKPVNRFTAMEVLSNKLFSPLPEEFIKTIGGSTENNSILRGAERYGLFNFNDRNSIVDYVLSIGPFSLKRWERNQCIVFEKNSNWNEPNRFLIGGIMLKIVDASSDNSLVYNLFNAGLLDTCDIPNKYLKEALSQRHVFRKESNNTFMLSVNSCTEDRWNELFGVNGKIENTSSHTRSWDVKPWMSNDSFLNGIFYSINRTKFAHDRGMEPSINYFSDSYMDYSETGTPYNNSQSHKDAIKGYEIYDSNKKLTYGYSKERAIQCFKIAVKQLVRENKIYFGSKDNPYIIDMYIWWMYQTDIKEYGEEIASYIEDAFNDERVCGGKIALRIRQDAATNWRDIYSDHLMSGQFDLCAGRIVNDDVYDPIKTLEWLKGDNSSTWTINWGEDTSKVTTNKPLIYDGKLWSYDALWTAAHCGASVQNGCLV